LAAAPARAARTSPRRAGGRAGALTGAVWAGYEVGDLLGSGGMGEVYLARVPSLDRLVALKVMALDVAADASLRRRWANEARALASLDHPQVVRVLASGEEAELPYLAMELLEGGSLAEELAGLRLAGRRHPPLAALELALQAARGLAAAHAAGLVHRDVKPGNLMRAGDGALKVVDFGLVRFAGEAALTVAGSALGTPAYMAPEQGRGESCDARSDVYALGCVLYELLTGRPPFAADTPEGLVFQHGFAEPELPRRTDPAIPAGLEQVCLACLQKDPSRRYADAGALAADLERLHAG
ncbi:MAG: serine/threonine protein kinase, partial [Planctomycetes bacterium]|nr:serine/threonine protein kinase [Planctomycetota bacterium]